MSKNNLSSNASNYEKNLPSLCALFLTVQMVLVNDP